MKIFILLLMATTSVRLSATILPTSKSEFCQRFNDPEIMTTISSEPDNLMAFRNQGGLFDGGLCWWHSRFQRNIFYLTIFRPDLNPPEDLEVLKIIREIRNGDSVVMIPGFSNFNEFSHTYQKEILKELSNWQLYDGVILSQWITGLRGRSTIRPALLKKMMDKSYEYVENEKRVAYHKLQIKGITAHAWLFVGMKKTGENYEIGFIDSNKPRMTQSYSYKNGDDSFFISSYGNFVPYLEFTREEKRLVNVAKSFCDIKGLTLGLQEKTQDYMLDLEEAKRNKFMIP